MGLKCFEPKGSFYIFPSVKETGLTGEEFATKLLEQEKVAVVPGSAFSIEGDDKINCIRINYSAPSDENLEKGIQLLAKTLEEFK